MSKKIKGVFDNQKELQAARDKLIYEYLKAGGKVTVCPPCERALDQDEARG